MHVGIKARMYNTTVHNLLFLSDSSVDVNCLHNMFCSSLCVKVKAESRARVYISSCHFVVLEGEQCIFFLLITPPAQTSFGWVHTDVEMTSLATVTPIWKKYSHPQFHH